MESNSPSSSSECLRLELRAKRSERNEEENKGSTEHDDLASAVLLFCVLFRILYFIRYVVLLHVIVEHEKTHSISSLKTCLNFIVAAHRA